MSKQISQKCETSLSSKFPNPDILWRITSNSITLMEVKWHDRSDKLGPNLVTIHKSIITNRINDDTCTKLQQYFRHEVRDVTKRLIIKAY